MSTQEAFARMDEELLALRARLAQVELARADLELLVGRELRQKDAEIRKLRASNEYAHRVIAAWEQRYQHTMWVPQDAAIKK